jgi:hypothetical protein
MKAIVAADTKMRSPEPERRTPDTILRRVRDVFCQ